MNLKLVAGLVASLMIVGCAGQKVKEEPVGAVPDRSASDTQTRAVTGGTTIADPFSDPSNPLSRNVIYFDYDSTQVRDVDIVNAHGRYAAGNPSAKVRLEGHTDERGSREYNIALGERRANSVRQLMMLQGAKGTQLDSVSFGEERPADPGMDEAAFAKNRRVEIIYEVK
ncbi:MAG: peptidoglycan-associated lipoprotein Pal [Thiotrichales bacterium]